MNGKWPFEYRWLYPLAPVLAVMGLTAFDIHGLANGTKNPNAADETPEKTTTPATMVRRESPTKVPSLPKYSVKLLSVGTGGVDYDAGSQLVVVNCAFTDECPEMPVVGISEMALVSRLQTDDGALLEGSTGFGIINPEIRDFKDARFAVQAKVPLNTRVVSMLNGVVTVLRARERSALTWREPFSSEVGTTRRVNGFELTLTKCEIAGDTMVAEWSCKAPVEAASDEKLWQPRQLKATLGCADKTALNPETGKESATAIRRVFKLRKKFPQSLELSFISELTKENLPFTVTGIVLEGEAGKTTESRRGENF